MSLRSPDYRRKYVMRVGLLEAICLIPAPMGRVHSDEAADMIEWLEMIVKRLKRDLPIKPVMPEPLSADEIAELQAEESEK